MQSFIRLLSVSNVSTGRCDWWVGRLLWTAAGCVSSVGCFAAAAHFDTAATEIAAIILVFMIGVVMLLGLINIDLRRLRDMGCPKGLILVPIVAGIAHATFPAVAQICVIAYHVALGFWPSRVYDAEPVL